MTATTQPALADVDLGDLTLWETDPPYELFARMRSEAPVHWSPLRDHPDEPGFWSITRWDDVAAISRDPETFSSERGGVLAITDYGGIPLELQRQQMLSMDPPRHDRIKQLFQRGFTPRRIAEHEDRIREIVVEALDAVAPEGRCDLVQDVGWPVVTRVIGSFLGWPRQDEPLMQRWVNQILGFGDPDLQPDPNETPALIQEAAEYVLGLVEERRADPTDDLISVLTHAEIDGRGLDDFEIFTGVAVLFSAGVDSTRATYTNGMKALLEHPDQLELLRQDPALIPSAVEESLRCFPAFSHFRRTTTKEIELHGRRIGEGEKLVLWYLSSNRDESRFEDPDRFDVRRDPNHQAFGGGGVHFCLGAALARLELRLLLEETLRRLPDLSLDRPPRRVRSMWLNQLKDLPVRFRPSA